MKKANCCSAALAAILFLVGAVCFAEVPGEAIYKTRCQSCHGAAGTPSAAMTKATGVKPVFDPAIRKLTAAQMFASTKNGKGKMRPVTGLTDAEIRQSVNFYRGLLKPRP
jgi:predicted CXXCH cytochrome family protein